MSDRSSDGFTLDELREEYDWMSDFMGRMAERIRGNTDVRSLAAYVAKLESENAKLRELSERMFDRVNYECRCCSIFCSDWDEDNECCVFATSMRELGIEV